MSESIGQKDGSKTHRTILSQQTKKKSARTKNGAISPLKLRPKSSLGVSTEPKVELKSSERLTNMTDLTVENEHLRTENANL